MMAVETKLGDDVLLLHHLEIDERVNALFEIQAAVKAQRDDLKAGDLIGSSVDFRVKLKDGGERWWNGFVTAMHEGGLTTRGTRSYAMTVRPKLWLLSQRSDCRIYLSTTTAQIIETLLSEHGITDYKILITQKLVTRDYSVQWNETDLDYMRRRMEQCGIAFWVEQAKGKHTLVFGDHYSSYDRAPEEEVRYAEGSAAQNHISEWRRSFAFTPGKRAAKDWSWLSMQAPGFDQTSFPQVPGNAAHELYEYPGRFDDSVSAEQATKMRIQATESGFETVEAASTVRTLGPGQTFTPVDVAKPDNKFAKQVVTAIRHVATDPTYETGGGTPSYDNTFTVIPATTIATPHRYTRRPRINGQQVALIAGPAGEEIFTNKYGQVKVWFPWDRRARKDGTDTIWIRVGQPWAGTTWGHQVIPRCGMECLVSYQEGDPDRPFIMALVPDPSNPTPYPLPDNKTRMTFRSNSYKSTGFNEMTFEDRTSGENMFFHAQKDHTTKIENNQTNSVGANHSNVVGQNQALTVGANQTQEVGGSANLTVGGTGAGAAALMAPLAGMAGQTAGMLGSALQAAMGAAGGGGSGGGSGGDSSGGSSGDLSGGGASGLAGLASAAGGLGSVASALSGLAGGSGGGGFADGLLGTAMGAVGAAGGGMGGIADTMMPQLASSLIGMLGGAGQQAQSQVGNGHSPRPDAGTALAFAGASLGQAAGSLFSMGGILNTTVGLMRTDSIGLAHAMQVGTSQAINIGQTKNENIGYAHNHTVGNQLMINVGDTMQITVGSVFKIVVGKSTLTMDKEGNVTITGTKKLVGFSDSVTMFGKVIDLNPSK